MFVCATSGSRVVEQRFSRARKGRLAAKISGERPPRLLVTGRGYGQADKEPDVQNTSAPPPQPSRVTPLKLGRP